MIKLFYAPGTCALATHIALEWIGEPYELQQVQLGDPEYLKINSLGQVPAIIDGDDDSRRCHSQISSAEISSG
jgi:glutathione S-transferase